jgi:long-chain fatty acid transport protein
LGLAYFHNDAPKVTGSGTFQLPPVGSIISAATGAFTSTNASSVIGLPDHANFGIVQKLTSDLDVRGGVTWTQWSSFKQELITFANPAQPPSLMVENWRDTISLSLGASYKLTPSWVLRGGLSYDETPVPDPQHRDLRLPDASRYGIAIGAGYALSDSTTIDLAYQHLFGGTVSMHVVTSTADQIVGTTNVSADILAFQVTYRY